MKDENDIPPGSAMEAWDNLHKTVEKHGVNGIIALAFLGTLLYLVGMLILSLLGLW